MFSSESQHYDAPAKARTSRSRPRVSAREQAAELTVRDALRTFAQVSRTVNKKKVHNTMPARVSARVPAESSLVRVLPAQRRVRNNDAAVVMRHETFDTSQENIARMRDRDLEMHRAACALQRRAASR